MKPLATSFRMVPLYAVLLLSACAQTPLIPEPFFQKPNEIASGGAGAASGGAGVPSGLRVTDNPKPPPAPISTVKPAAPGPNADEPADITLMFDQAPLPAFIQTVFGTILKANFSIEPAVSSRTDLVTLRTGRPQNPAQVLETTKLLLKGYGIAVTEMGGFYRIAPDASPSDYAPEIRRGRAQPEIPLPLRPVFQLVELTAVKMGDVGGWLRTMFGKKLGIQEDPTRNGLLLNGQAADLTAAMEAIQVLDQPLMRGRASRRIIPSVLSAEELGRRLLEVLAAEGYFAVSGASVSAPLVLIPVSASNSVLAFAADPKVLDHVVEWARQLDTLENAGKGSGGYFTYAVKYADAADLAKTMSDLISSGVAAAAAPAAGSGAPARKPARIVVNNSTNTLIFLAQPDEYAQLLGILKDLDQPAKSALIEVTVAEVRTIDKNQLGLEWNLHPTIRAGGTLSGGTMSGLGLGSGGLSLSYANGSGQVMGMLNALANKNLAKILSSPRLMARNGETATIQVGQDVPIVTSQQSNANTGSSTGGVLQTIQYRTTGVILKVKPIIHAGNRVELEISQEVSSALSTQTGVTSSPTFSSRKVDTKLSIRDGATVLLGGLMSTTSSNNETGVPLLKDVPVLGQVFRVNTDSDDRTELIVLITPYVIDDDSTAEEITRAFREKLGAWAHPAPALKSDAAVQRPNAAQ